jgi:2-amino-4-hydroxy-6-hydroxymethyldihydropteridine diphosphokinase/dihydropteroate synthase
LLIENHGINSQIPNLFKSFNNLLSFKKSFVLNPELVGIVNITDDSFSDGGKFYAPENAIKQVLSLVSDGASVIDIGAQSTRPGAVMKSAEDEINALRPVLDGIKHLDLEISIDTFREEVVEWLLKNYKISWINDVKCSFNDKTLINNLI